MRGRIVTLGEVIACPLHRLDPSHYLGRTHGCDCLVEECEGCGHPIEAGTEDGFCPACYEEDRRRDALYDEAVEDRLTD